MDTVGNTQLFELFHNLRLKISSFMAYWICLLLFWMVLLLTDKKTCFHQVPNEISLFDITGKQEILLTVIFGILLKASSFSHLERSYQCITWQISPRYANPFTLAEDLICITKALLFLSNHALNMQILYFDYCNPSALIGFFTQNFQAVCQQ